jgi:hypothetical protein
MSVVFHPRDHKGRIEVDAYADHEADDDRDPEEALRLRYLLKGWPAHEAGRKAWDRMRGFGVNGDGEGHRG